MKNLFLETNYPNEVIKRIADVHPHLNMQVDYTVTGVRIAMIDMKDVRNIASLTMDIARVGDIEPLT